MINLLFSQKTKGTEAISLEFTQPTLDKTMASTYFLAGNRYYHSLKQYKGKTKTLELLEFTNNGTFNAYSKNK